MDFDEINDPTMWERVQRFMAGERLADLALMWV